MFKRIVQGLPGVLLQQLGLRGIFLMISGNGIYRGIRRIGIHNRFVLCQLSGGWAIIIITILASAVVALKFPIEVEEEDAA